MTKRLLLLTMAPLVACTVGPDYQRPAAIVPTLYKEATYSKTVSAGGDGWKLATPRADLSKGAWWSVFNDPVLDGLERQVAVTNQNVQQSEANYRQAVALVHEAQASLFPTIGLKPSVTRETINSLGSFPAGGGTGGSSAGKAITEYSLQGSASWDLDVWGRIRRQVESNQAAAQVSAADLANATLSAQGTLATDYFNLRASDSLIQLLTDTVTAYRKTLQITQAQYELGTASRGDVATADTQLKTTQAQLVGAGVQRAEYEHAIAVLTGHPPAALSLPAAELTTVVPVIPVDLPSALLERRPDIAAAERTMAEQNAQIGVAVAAYYPDISLSAAFGYAGNPISKLFTLANQVWSLGASASETLVDGGLRRATLSAAHAGYDAYVASYRQTVLNAFQQVEDDLSSLRILEQQAAVEDSAVTSAKRAVDVTLTEYRGGTIAYTSVITEQTQLLSDQQTALTIRQNRLLAAVGLLQALGGGWQSNDLPAKQPLDLTAAIRP
jgi:NodT family efflux transporter outer membrane factor (OMF) lipoprotein